MYCHTTKNIDSSRPKINIICVQQVRYKVQQLPYEEGEVYLQQFKCLQLIKFHTRKS